MGIIVQLRSERGEILDEVLDSKDILARASGKSFSGSRLLCYIVPWGDAIFNQSQADDLASDISRILADQSGSDVAHHLRKIDPLIVRLSSESHRYVWFIGD